MGELIKDFELGAPLGRGGMGEVYRAKHRLIGTEAAIKFLATDWVGDPAIVERFFNEARAAARIKHAGIIKIFDVGYHTDNRPYLIMEYLEGESLATRIERRGALDLDECKELIRQVASVLQATHGAGIVHRDLKPDNLFVVGDAELPRGERIKILDFGIAKLHFELARTSPGVQMGTPEYMAPELWTDAATADGRTDIYAFGCVAFQVLTGRLPFVAASPGELCNKHLHESPLRARSLRADIPEALDAIVARMLSKRKEERPGMSEVLRGLDAAHAPTSAPATALPPRKPSGVPAPPAGPIEPVHTGIRKVVTRQLLLPIVTGAVGAVLATAVVTKLTCVQQRPTVVVATAAAGRAEPRAVEDAAPAVIADAGLMIVVTTSDSGPKPARPRAVSATTGQTAAPRPTPVKSEPAPEGVVLITTEHAFDGDRGAPKLVAIATSAGALIPRSGDAATQIKAAHARAAIVIRSTAKSPPTAATMGTDVEQKMVRVTVEVEIRSVLVSGAEQSIWSGSDTQTRFSIDDAYAACVRTLEPSIRAAITGALPELMK